ncbi:MAG: hypothetical protein ACI4HI_06250 [Lachnospiraceae bacterium]
MIHIITKYKEAAHTIRDFESFFEKYVLAKEFEAIDLEVMKQIDQAVLLDKSSGAIQTRFGITDILHLSTGCKIVLSYLYIKRQQERFCKEILDVTECGSNALEVLFQCADQLHDSETVFLLRHSNQLLKCADRAYCVNGHEAKSLYEGVTLYG